MTFNNFHSFSATVAASKSSTNPHSTRPNLLRSLVAVVMTIALTGAGFIANPVAAQDETSSVLLGGAECSGDNVELVTETTSGDELVVVDNITPDDDGNWQVTIALPALSEAIIAWATCFDGETAIVDYSPISLRVQPGVDVGGIIELAARPIEGAGAAEDPAEDPAETEEAAAEQPEEEVIERLPETGPVTVPLVALALALIAGGLTFAFVSREQQLIPAKSWPRSHWDK